MNKKFLSGLVSAICFTCLSTTAFAQTQLGGDIDGDVAGVSSILTVSLSSEGNRLAVGAMNDDGGGFRSGMVRVYQWSGLVWEQLGADINGQAVEEMFGHSMSLSSDGNRLAVGVSSNNGSVRVYQWSGAAWAQLGSDIHGEAVADSFGGSVSLSSGGNRLAVGADGNNGNGNNAGHVRVYEWSGTAWARLGIDIDGEAADDRFGDSVSMSADGNRLAVGAPYNDGSATGAGHVRVYDWSGTAWEQVGFDIDGESEGDHSGTSVSLSDNGNRLAIGANGNDDNGTGSGQVRVYDWSGTAWEQVGMDIDGEAAGDGSGRSISLSADGNRLAIGASGNDGNGEGSGHVRIYQWLGTKWAQLGADIDGESGHHNFGYFLSLSSDGNRVASGTGEANLDGNNPGHVRVYDLSMLNVFAINPGLNDAWYNRATNGQGFLISVFPVIQQMFVAWFTYDTERPPEDVQAVLGEPGHRWLTAQGSYVGDTASLTIYLTEGGVFDAADPPAQNDGIGDGTMTIEFADCTEGLVTYELISPDVSGEIPIQRITNDNVALCETLAGQ